MNSQPQPPGMPARRCEPAAIILEALVIAVVGACIALLANRVSPRGLNLARDYFPKIKPVSTLPVAVTNSAPAPISIVTNTISGSTPTNAATSEIDLAAARLKAKGLQVVNFEQMKKLLHDPGYAQGSIIFVDARDDDNYQAGHIPGAYQLDYYHPDKYLAAVVMACQSAKQIVVYCTGGDCEDSEMTAIMLRDGGVPNQKLFVYVGGITEWDGSGEPEETGARNSGQMRQANK